MTIKEILKQKEAELKEMNANPTPPWEGPARGAYLTQLQVKRAEVKQLKKLIKLGAEILPKQNVENTAYVMQEGEWVAMDTTSLIDNIFPRWDQELKKLMAEEPAKYNEQWYKIYEEKLQALNWEKENDGEPLEIAKLEAEVEAYAKFCEIIGGLQSELDGIFFQNRLLLVKVAKIEHELTTHSGLWCIDKDPADVSIDWIRKNAFRLK